MNDTLEEAKGYIFQLLKIRIRSEKEIRDKLKRKGFTQPTADNAVGYFKSIDLVDDVQFARKWIEWRLAKPFGINRIRFELEQKGVAKSIVEEEIKNATEEYRQEDIIEQLARRQAAKYRNVPPDKAKQRVYGYLMRRGYDSSMILRAIRRLKVDL